MSHTKAIHIIPRTDLFQEVPEGTLNQEMGRDWILWFNSIIDAVPVIKFYSETLNPASVLANTTAEQLFTVTGVETTDLVFINKPTVTAGLGIAGYRASAQNQIGITFVNATAAPIDPGSEVYQIVTIRR